MTRLDSRKLIGQAHQAFEVLKRYSTSNNVKLRLVAEYVVATRKLPANNKPAAGST